MRHKFRLVFWLVCTLAIMMAIFCFSSQDADSSRELSNGLLLRIKGLIVLLPDIFGGTDGNKIRKYAHLFEYICLGGSSFMFFDELYYFRNRRTGLAAFSSLAFGLFYACTDEVHQIFVPGRACQFRDIVIDFSGLLLATATLGAVSALIIKKREHKNE